LFPTFALIALLIVGPKGDKAGLTGRRQDDPGRSGFWLFCVDYRIALLGVRAAWFIVALCIFPAPRST
jgi:membrane protein GlpM